ncbi:sensor histidine kinase [Frankia sp. R82]|uniref:sensor histidine kinase n=1 Tax=Frankia sp. R82 TaxID=2950553 RepID=UPI002042FAEA|nr:sensor histidine kinase [Frankia sp. R82]MCM3883057.1 ATP-binding protein [Frankia sp. R82]
MASQPTVLGEVDPTGPGTARNQAEPGEDGRRRPSGWTTARWLSAGVGSTLTVLVALGVLGTWLLAHATSVNQRLIDRSTPALLAAVRLDAALVGQESGVRGFGMTGQAEFLQPYRQGLADQDRLVGDLRRLLTVDGTPTGPLDALLGRASTWHRVYADRVVAAPPGAPVAFATAQATVGKAAFDGLRAASITLQDRLGTARAQARTDLIHVRRLRNWTFGAIAAVILVGAVLAFVGLRRGVSTPLARLASDAERVAAGSFEHPIRIGGPADIQTVARAVDLMRSRLATALAASEQARSELDRQAEELRRSNTDLEQFAYVASHDLQEPLRKVTSFCQLLQRRYAGQLDERGDQYMTFIVDGAARMQKLIQDLLAFSRAGRADRPAETVDLEQLHGRVVEGLDLVIQESGAQVSHDPLPTVTGHPAHLEMLLTNLLGNAIKFRHPERAPLIHVGAARDGDHWRISVTDNGIGIEAQYSERIFVIFQRLHSREEYAGTGIGLALCKKIIEYHGGTIHLDTELAVGTRVVFTLPA